MGYSTDFTGELKFTKELKATELAKLKTFMGEDCREHPEWNATNMTYIDLEISDDFSGLKWDGSEKTYDLVEKVNLIISEMKKDFPDFGLEGSLFAQGEDSTDRWVLLIDNGIAIEKKVALKGKKCKCPNCEEEFFLEEME